MLLPLPCRPANDTAHGRRGDARRRARLRRPSTGFCRAAAAMLPVGLVRGGFLRGFAGPPRRCLPMGSSEAAFCGVFQCRRGGASRWARPRRLSAGFCRAAAAMLPGGLVRGGLSAGFCRAAYAMLPDGLVRGGFLRAFPRSLRGSSEAGFPRGFFQCRRGGASRGARLRRLSTGFSNAAEAVLPDGLVRGGFPRGFAGPPRRCFPMGSSEAAFCGVFQRRRCAQRRRTLLSFSPPPPGRTSFFTIRPDNDAARAHSRSRKPAGSPYPFPHFPRAPESCFFLYPAVRPTIPRTVAETMLAEGLV